MKFVGFHQCKKGDLTVLDAWGFTINGRFTEKETPVVSWFMFTHPIADPSPPSQLDYMNEAITNN